MQANKQQGVDKLLQLADSNLGEEKMLSPPPHQLKARYHWTIGWYMYPEIKKRKMDNQHIAQNKLPWIDKCKIQDDDNNNNNIAFFPKQVGVG